YVFLVDGIHRPAQTFAAIVHAQCRHAQLLIAVAGSSLATQHYTIKSHTPGVVFAKAAAQVYLRREVLLARIAAGHACKRFVIGTLGYHINAAANTTVWRYTAHQSARAF